MGVWVGGAAAVGVGAMVEVGGTSWDEVAVAVAVMGVMSGTGGVVATGVGVVLVTTPVGVEVGGSLGSTILMTRKATNATPAREPRTAPIRRGMERGRGAAGG